MELLFAVATYLAEKLSLEPGKQVFCYEMPDKPDECICVYEVQTSLTSPPQIDAISRRIRVSARSTGNAAAATLAESCWQRLWTDGEEEVPTGFIKLNGTKTVFVDLRGKPLWDKSDQQNRKVFSFEAVITTTK